MADEESLDRIVKKISVSYNILPWYFYPVNWAANFPFRKLKGYETLQESHRFQATVKKNGEQTGRVSRAVQPKEHQGIFYGILFDTTTGQLNPVTEWAEDGPRENQLNEGKFSGNRKMAVDISDSTSGHNMAFYQHDKSFSDSWYSLPFKLPIYAAMFPVAVLSKGLRKFFKGKEFIELGKLYEVEGTGLPGSVTLDQDVIHQILSLGLGRYYDLRHGDETVARISRSPIAKLLTLGAKEHYDIVLYTDDVTINNSVVPIVDYLKNEFRARHFVPTNIQTPPSNLFRYDK